MVHRIKKTIKRIFGRKGDHITPTPTIGAQEAGAIAARKGFRKARIQSTALPPHMQAKVDAKKRAREVQEKHEKAVKDFPQAFGRDEREEVARRTQTEGSSPTRPGRRELPPLNRMKIAGMGRLLHDD